MKEKVLSLVLALVLCLGLTVPALAAGEPMTVNTFGWLCKYAGDDTGRTLEIDPSAKVGQVQSKHASVQGEELEWISSSVGVAVTITASNVLRKESGLYNVYTNWNETTAPQNLTFYVIPDEGTDLTYTWEGEKANGVRGTVFSDTWWNRDENVMMAYESFLEVDPCEMGNTYTTHISRDPERPTVYSALGFKGDFICESDFKQLVPFEGSMKCANWAAASMKTAFERSLFPDACNPYVVDMARPMTRAEFAEAAVNLYRAMPGTPGLSGIDSSHPFTDVGEYDYNVGYAYNLGFVTGTSKTAFSPDATLTREQAAVMLARVYSKLHGDIPAATATTFADDAQVGGWAKSGVAFMADKGIVSGVGGNKFAPQQTLSIQEAMTMAVRMLENLK